LAQGRHDRAGQLDGRGQLVAIVLSMWESVSSSAAPRTPFAGVGHHDVDPVELGEGRIDDVPAAGRCP